MSRIVSSVAILVTMAVSVAVRAQSGGTMAEDDKMGMMAMKDTTYVGCVEAGSAPGAFTLTHVAGADHTKKGKKKDAMDKMAMDDNRMASDALPPATLSLTGSSVALSKHIGHKVSVTGSVAHETMGAMDKDAMGNATSTFTVKSLKMLGATCS